MAESGAPRQVLAAQEHPEAVWAPGLLVLVSVPGSSPAGS